MKGSVNSQRSLDKELGQERPLPYAVCIFYKIKSILFRSGSKGYSQLNRINVTIHAAPLAQYSIAKFHFAWANKNSQRHHSKQH